MEVRDRHLGLRDVMDQNLEGVVYVCTLDTKLTRRNNESARNDVNDNIFTLYVMIIYVIN